MRHDISKKLAVVAWLLLLPGLAQAEALVRAVTDKTSYNVGSQVLMRLVPAPGAAVPLDVVFAPTVRYAGESRPEFTTPSSEVWSLPTGSAGGSYSPLWTIPANARTGRYEIDLVGYAKVSGQIVIKVHQAGSFAVHRKLVKVESIKLGKTFYVPGDPVACNITLKNLTDHSLHGLRVEFSNRYWPWIAGPAQQAAASIVTVAADLSLAAGSERVIHSSRVAVAPAVTEPAVHQYGVVVWDHDRKNVLDIAFSRLVFIRPPGVDSPEPYPLQYMYTKLSDVNTTSYRHFYPPGLNSGAVRFDSSHTMFVPGRDATIKFSVGNPGTTPWKQISVVARLLGPEGKEIERKTLAERRDLLPHEAPMRESVTFALPGSPGLYHAEVTLRDPSGNAVAQSELDIGVNSLPKSILIFCAHEDDEGGWTGLIRAAVENHIPIHFVYFTSGDAGSCDLYYEHSCSPAEAMNFGELRMAETRAALGHLGVGKRDIYFLGLPDGGSGEIWYHHLDPGNPYLSVLLACDHAPYQDVFQPNLPYARKSVEAAVKALIMKFHPQVIVTAHPPAEGHIDHIVNGYFVVQALQELVREHALSPANVKVYVDRVYDRKTLPPTPYHYAKRVLYVSGEVMALGQEANWFYQSQGGNRMEGNIQDFDQLPRTLVYRQVLDWRKHEGWNEKP
ncbi:MAG: PIG-L family deacetylase [Acidobacteria bacterium]|nr:PIG-L family deacetylase [Acidobacteriota bacterium]